MSAFPVTKRALRCAVWGCLLVALCTLTACIGGKSPSGRVTNPQLPQSSAANRPATSAATAQTPLCVVLALPGTGPVGPLADKIRAGANAAQLEMNQAGLPLNVRNIDTDRPDWIAQLDALPMQCAVVGGPLLTPDFMKAQQAGVLQRRNVFAFIPQLGGEGALEGRGAWRFFPGPQDQINALLRFTRNELSITSYGTFAPSDAYSARMVHMFEKTVRGLGGQVQSATYPPNEMSQWSNAAQQLLRPRLVNKVPVSTAHFQALFLPDSWKNMEMVTNSLLYNGEDRQVLLGTSLWEMGLRSVGSVNTYNFQLAVFPGAWDPRKTVPALQGLGSVDFWNGLGYDFVRFAANLGLTAPVQAVHLNERIQQAQKMFWAIAPMHWSADGKAQQDLFLFTLAPNGFVPVDVAIFKSQREQILARAAARARGEAPAATAGMPGNGADPASALKVGSGNAPRPAPNAAETPAAPAVRNPALPRPNISARPTPPPALRPASTPAVPAVPATAARNAAPTAPVVPAAAQ